MRATGRSTGILGVRGALGGSSAVPRSSFTLAVARVVGVVFGVFLFIALVTYTEPGGRGNLFGAAGRLAAWPFLATLGYSAFVLYGLMAFWGVATLFGREPSRPLINAVGIVLLVLATAALFSAVMDAADYRRGDLYGPGGRVGGQLSLLIGGLTGGTALILLSCFGAVAGLVLATDRLLLALLNDISGEGERLGRWAGASAPRFMAAVSRGTGRIRGLVSTLTGGMPKRGGSVRIPILERRHSLPTPTPEAPREPPEEELEEPEEQEEQEELEEPVEAEQLALFEGAEPEVKKPARRPAAKSRKRKRTKKNGDAYRYPPLTLLDPVKTIDPRDQDAMIRENAAVLEATLADFKVEAEVVDYSKGPVVTLFELDLAPGVKVNRIHNLSEDLAVALKAPSVRVVSPLPGKSTIGLEVPNPMREDVRLKSMISSEAWERHHGAIPIFIGTDVSGGALIEDLTMMPHILIAGATGAGKSVCINSILISILMTRTPEQVRLILIDPKQVELAFFARVPHLMSPVVIKATKALGVLEWLVDQMEERYALFHSMEVRNIAAYNEQTPEEIKARKVELGITEEDEVDGVGIPDQLPYIVIVVDEYGDLMLVAGKEIENLITRLAQKSRAVGIHIVLATQRPSTDVITGLIKANLPCRTAFQVASKIDSRVVLDRNGAEKLLGRGDMLYLPPRCSHLVRAQGTFVSDGEVKRVVAFLADRVEQEFNGSLEKAQSAQLLQGEDKDPYYDEAVEIVLEQQRGSASLLQRALGVGYTRGSRIMDQMHKEGIVGPYRGSKAREVLMTLDEYRELRDAPSDNH